MINVNRLPALDIDVGIPGSHKYSPVVSNPLVSDLAIGIIIAILANRPI